MLTQTSGPLAITDGSQPAVDWSPIGQAWVEALFDARVGVLNSSDAVCADAENVKTWQDQSGNARHAVQSLVGRQRTYQASSSEANGNPAIYKAVRAGYANVVTPEFTAGAIYFVTNFGDGTTATFDGLNMLVAGPGSASAMRIVASSGGDSTLFDGASTIVTDRLAFDGDTGAGDNVVLPMPYRLAVARSPAPITQTWAIGGSNAQSSRTWQGSISAVVFTSGTESDADKRRLESWLAHEFGIDNRLESSHPHKTQRPAI
jgi:hypothetical protein